MHRLVAAAPILALAAVAAAQPAPQPDAKPAPAKPEAKAADPKNVTPDALAWLAGCWRGEVDEREFREHWMPLRGGLLIGTSHTVSKGATLDFEYLRIERKADGLDYVLVSEGQEARFRLVGMTQDAAKGGEATVFTFEDPAREFPRRIVYRRDPNGWLYAHVEGRVAGADRRIIYPMRRVDCETGEVIER